MAENVKATLDREDRLRMERLSEEIEARIYEMVEIAKRNVLRVDPKFAEVIKLSTGQPVLQYHKVQTPKTGATNLAGIEFGGIEMTCYCSGDNCCLCYDYDEGTCSVC